MPRDVRHPEFESCQIAEANVVQILAGRSFNYDETVIQASRP